MRDYLLLVTLSAIWGASFLFIKLAIAEVTPVTMAASRIFIGFVLLYLLARMDGQSLPSPLGREGRRQWGRFAVIGVMGNAIPFSLISWGEIEVTSSLAAILIGVMPVFTVGLAHICGVERLGGPLRLVGIGAGFAGLVLLVGPETLGGLGGAALHEFAVIGAAASYAATAVYARRLALRMPALTLAAGSMAASTVIMLPAAAILEEPWRLEPGSTAVVSILFLGLFATGLASIVYFKLLAAAGPTFSSMINYLIPVFGVTLGVTFLSEAIALTDLAALALILCGITLVKSPAARLGGPPKAD